MADEMSLTSGQEPTAGAQAAGTAGSGYRVQAADATSDERSGTDGGAPSPKAQSNTTDTTPNTNDAMTLEQALAALDAARKEAAANRRAKQELDARIKADEDAKLSETERLQMQYAEAQREIELLRLERQDIAVRSRVELTAHNLGIKPELALKLIDPAAIAFDEAGDPTNITELLQQAMTDYGLTSRAAAPAAGATPSAGQPGLVARVAPAMGATNPPRGAANAQPIARSVHDIPWKRG